MKLVLKAKEKNTDKNILEEGGCLSLSIRELPGRFAGHISSHGDRKPIVFSIISGMSIRVELEEVK